MQTRVIGLMLLVLTLLVNGLFSGTTGKIAGVVKDKENGEPLIGANIILDGHPLGATTDLDGSYFILNVPPGTYDVVVQYIGYQDVRVNGVSVSIDLTTRQNFELSSATIELGDEVVVVADRDVVQKDLTSSESRVSSEKIESLPVEEIDDVLQIQSGVTRGADGSFHIRGGRSSEIAYWVNGSSITDGFDNSRGLNIENESIQELQVISGTFNAEFGNAMSGIVNVVTKEGGSDFHGSIKAYTGDYVTNDDDIFYNLDQVQPKDNYSVQASLSGPVPLLGNKLRFFATGRHNYDDGYFYGRRVFNPDGSFFVDEYNQDSTFNADRPVDVLRSQEFLDQYQAVSMNWRRRWSGQSKLTFQATPTLKFNLEGIASTEHYRDYNHGWKYNPDGDVEKFFDNRSLDFLVNHTLSGRTFYTFKLSYLNREFNEYAFKDINDPRYQIDVFNIPTIEPGNFSQGGLNLHRYERSTNNYIAKFDLSSQVHNAHLIKAGVEFQYSELSQDDYNLIPADPGVAGATIPDLTTPGRDRFSRDPVQYAVYIQDKIELDNVIINAGLRFDYFYSKGLVLEDPRDPDIYRPLLPAHQAMTFEERQSIWYRKADPKYQISPRLGVAYPISQTGVIHFSFGQFLQIPPLRLLYQHSEYKISTVSGASSPFGNPDLDAQNTVQYELGLQQQLSDDVKIDVTGFYRDIRDWVSTGPQIDTYLAGTRYNQYTNKDYANVRGIALSLTKRMSNHFAADFVYQFQVAEGTNSSAEEEFFQQNSGYEPTIQLSPLDWDQSHNVNASLTYGGNTWNASVLGRFNTGLPYTPATNIDEAVVIGPNATNDSPKNSRRRPTNFVVDLRAHKSMRVHDFNFILFARVFNLLDRRNEVNVFSDTGRSDVTLTAAATTDPQFLIRPDFYDRPREVQVGLEFEF